MGFGLRYRCSHCETEHSIFQSRPVYYQFPDGIQVTLYFEPAWCNGCKRFAPAEQLATREQYQAKLSALDAGGIEGYYRDSFGSEAPSTEWSLAELAALVEISPNAWFGERRRSLVRGLSWARDRRTPPRCLQCGSFDFQYLPEDAEYPMSFPHFGCEGSFEHCSYVRFTARDLFYSPDGLRLEDD